MEEVIKKRAPNSVRAVAFFKEYIDRYARTGIAVEIDADFDESADLSSDEPEFVLPRLKSLVSALLNSLKLVVITLEEDDDAQVIFETLNSKNEPLTAMELVRNNIFQRAAAESEHAEALFESRWEPFDRPFWQQTAPRARPRRPRVDHYLSHALTAQTGDETSMRELYAEYRAFARPRGRPRFPNVQEELDALLQFVPVYLGLEGEGDNADLSWIGGKSDFLGGYNGVSGDFCGGSRQRRSRDEASHVRLALLVLGPQSDL